MTAEEADEVPHGREVAFEVVGDVHLHPFRTCSYVKRQDRFRTSRLEGPTAPAIGAGWYSEWGRANLTMYASRHPRLLMRDGPDAASTGMDEDKDRRVRGATVAELYAIALPMPA